MAFDLSDIIGALEEALPILGTISGHPELAGLAAKMIEIAEDEIARRRSTSNMTRAEVLEDAKTTFAVARQENDALKLLGHEND